MCICIMYIYNIWNMVLMCIIYTTDAILHLYCILYIVYIIYIVHIQSCRHRIRDFSREVFIYDFIHED